MIRAQYFFRPSEAGLCAWDVRRLVELSRDFPVEIIKVSDIAELDEPHWYGLEGDSPTCRSLLTHIQLIDDADLHYPIILDPDGRVMDGMHRVCKSVLEGKKSIPAVRFPVLPDPDFVGIDPHELPYDD